MAAIPDDRRLEIYLVALAAGTLATFSSLVVFFGDLGNPPVIGALALVAAVAERGRVRLSNKLEESISLVPTLFAAVLFGPLGAMLIAAASFSLELRRP